MINRLPHILAALLLLAVSCSPNGPDVPPEPSPTDPWEGANICGTVLDTSGQPVEGAVVSDGHVCSVTNSQGRYGLVSPLKNTDFVWVSTPDGYCAPVESALPVFYRRLDSFKPDGSGKYTGVDFTLGKIQGHGDFTLFIAADPQPRSTGATYDKIGFHGFDCIADMCRDMRETAASIKDRPVYGLMLGDICHNDCSLYKQYVNSMSSNGFPTYHVIGNHDHDLNIAGDIASARTFESWFGPTNYSFNLGNCHFIVLDNMMVIGAKRATNSGDDLGDGLRDDIWEWLKNDLKYVDESRTIMLCAHSPMYHTLGGGMRSRKSMTFDGKGISNHYADVDALLKKYPKVYAWAGHVHNTYNHVDKDNPHTETHTLSRVTGQLWTNEWESGGTPRGYVILDCRNGEVTWKFKPIVYESGTNSLSTKPEYKYREWNFEGGVAKMKSDGSALTDGYQMHVYAPGTYASGDNLVYVNVFLWDELWKTPKWTTNGSTSAMKRVTTGGKYVGYDIVSREINSWYKKYSKSLSGDSSYSADPDECASMFTASVNAAHGSGTVSVEDRFGRTYKQSVTW